MRAFVHHRDEKADELASLGADIVVGDFHDLGSLREAMAGVKRAYFGHPARSYETFARDFAQAFAPAGAPAS